MNSVSAKKLEKKPVRESIHPINYPQQMSILAASAASATAQIQIAWQEIDRLQLARRTPCVEMLS